MIQVNGSQRISLVDYMRGELCGLKGGGRELASHWVQQFVQYASMHYNNLYQ